MFHGSQYRTFYMLSSNVASTAGVHQMRLLCRHSLIVVVVVVVVVVIVVVIITAVVVGYTIGVLS